MGQEKRILIIDFTNFEDYPIGGYLSFARSMIESFGNEIALVGITTDKKDPVGIWFRKEIDGSLFDFFAMARYSRSKTKHLFPDRLVSYLLLKYYERKIFRINIKNVFLQRQEMLLALTQSSSLNICYCFAGLENPLAISKYWYASVFSGWFEKLFFSRLRYAKTVLASGDGKSIKEMIERSKGKLAENGVIKFPTRINTNIFKPLDREEIRRKLNIPQGLIMVVTTGRIAPLKGWKFMVDSYIQFVKTIPYSMLYFVGEGEDQDNLKHYIYEYKLDDKIILAGKKSQEEVALYLNASDLFIMGSYKEGWSTSLIEAVACGAPACVTDFSSAREIIEIGISGYVVEKHEPYVFAENMIRALKISRPVKSAKIMSLSSDRLKSDILRNWKLI